jgi:hypothetical protein
MIDHFVESILGRKAQLQTQCQTSLESRSLLSGNKNGSIHDQGEVDLAWLSNSQKQGTCE